MSQHPVNNLTASAPPAVGHNSAQQSPQQQVLSITFDEADIDLAALQHARRRAIKTLVQGGLTDLNAMTANDWDKLSFVLLMAYHNKVAERNHGYGLINWACSFRGEDIPFFGDENK